MKAGAKLWDIPKKKPELQVQVGERVPSHVPEWIQNTWAKSGVFQMRAHVSTSGRAREIKEKDIREKKCLDKQKTLVSIFSSRISSFSYSQSRSFTAAPPPPPPSVFVDKKESRTKMPTISSSSGRNAGGHQDEKPPKAMTTKICIAIRSFEDLVPGNTISGLPADVRKIRLPESRVLYTVLRSPHVDKKSREQFEMRMKKQLLVAKVQSHELRDKYFWLKRQRIFGAQYEIQFHCKTRLDKDKLQKLLL
ncbi:40S RIBOSOMAL PROTEIN S10 MITOCHONDRIAL [Salix purpurea]|uniref:40S RIBOSOMAL PROTEIN S10 MITOCHONDRIAL n=1 Tax=Salix purpurea TaxID=77065 RepID=A0A9Q0V3R2_SALPP|nr:40S RIBOSOMAL PROTEIN S10 MITOCHONDRIAL [Salix purpurea]